MSPELVSIIMNRENFLLNMRILKHFIFVKKVLKYLKSVVYEIYLKKSTIKVISHQILQTLIRGYRTLKFETYNNELIYNLVGWFAFRSELRLFVLTAFSYGSVHKIAFVD